MKKFNKITIYLLFIIILSVFCALVVSAAPLRVLNQKARAKYQAARQQYVKEVNWWKTARQQFVSARAKYIKYKNSANKEAYQEKARNFLEKTVEVLIKKLESLKVWVSNRKALSDSDKQAIVAQIEEDIAWLNNKKSEISTATPDQIRAKAKEVRDYWRNHRVRVKKIIGQILVARLNWVIAKFDSASTRLHSKINDLKAAGKNVSQLEAWLSDFDQKIQLAKEKRDLAKEKYQDISSFAEANQLFSQVHQFIKEANQYLRDAYKRLVEIIKGIKKVNLSTSAVQ